MRKLGIALTLLLCFSFTSCLAGPHQLRRSVDDWDHNMYVDTPWLDAALWVVPVYPLLYFGAGIGDFFVGDAYTFWFNDAFSGYGGAGFVHFNPEHTDGYVNSLWSDETKWLRIEGRMDRE